MMEAPHLPVTLLKPRHRNGPGGWGAQADRARPETPWPCPSSISGFGYTVGRERAEAAPYVCAAYTIVQAYEDSHGGTKIYSLRFKI
jgi:hypothetical protein